MAINTSVNSGSLETIDHPETFKVNALESTIQETESSFKEFNSPTVETEEMDMTLVIELPKLNVANVDMNSIVYQEEMKEPSGTWSDVFKSDSERYYEENLLAIDLAFAGVNVDGKYITEILEYRDEKVITLSNGVVIFLKNKGYISQITDVDGNDYFYDEHKNCIEIRSSFGIVRKFNSDGECISIEMSKEIETDMSAIINNYRFEELSVLEQLNPFDDDRKKYAKEMLKNNGIFLTTSQIKEISDSNKTITLMNGVIVQLDNYGNVEYIHTPSSIYQPESDITYFYENGKCDLITKGNMAIHYRENSTISVSFPDGMTAEFDAHWVNLNVNEISLKTAEKMSLCVGSMEFGLNNVQNYEGEYIYISNEMGYEIYAPLSKFISTEEGYTIEPMTEEEREKFVSDVLLYYQAIKEKASLYDENFNEYVSQQLRTMSLAYIDGNNWTGITLNDGKNVVMDLTTIDSFDWIVKAYTHELGHVYDKSLGTYYKSDSWQEVFGQIHVQRNSELMGITMNDDDGNEWFARCVDQYYFFPERLTNITIDVDGFDNLYDYMDHLLKEGA